MTRQERIQTAFNYLKLQGLAFTQRNLSEKMGAAESNVSKALKGDEKVLTNKFLKRFNSTFNNIFDEDWLLSGRGEMLCRTITQNGEQNNIFGDNNGSGDINLLLLKELEEQRKLTASAQEQVNRLLSIIEKMSIS